MKELLHSIRNNQTQITDTKSLIIIWLGRRDSNPRMPVPKTGALPLGHAPLMRLYYTLEGLSC
jgi:hypothetical protein